MRVSGIWRYPGQELHGGDAPALWHLVGHPPQVTHFNKNLRHQVPKSWKKMFHFISYAANPINKTEGQQFKPKPVTKQTPSTEPKVNSFNKSRYVYTGNKQCLASGPLHILQNKPHQQTRSQQFKQHLRPTEANPINKPGSNSPTRS